MDQKVYHRLYKLNCFLLIFMFSVMALITNAQDESGSESIVMVRNIAYEGNKITRERIITRELLFKTGDTLLSSELESLLIKSRENLMNTSLFNFVVYDVVRDGKDPPSIDVTFTFTERWYIWPWPILEFADRNINTWWKENRDLSRMSYGVVLKWENFRGRKELLEITTRFGYIEQYGLDYTIPYLNKNETLGLGIGAAYGRTKEVPVININDRLEYYKDDKDYVMEAVSSYLSLIYRKQIYNTHTLRLQYDWQEYNDTLVSINPYFSVGGVSNLQYFSLSYQYKSDHRDNKPYPLKGHYFDVALVKKGFGILDNAGLDVFYVLTTFRKYFQLGERFYFASGLNSKFSSGKEQSFFMDRAIGYDRDIVRGYEYYVVHGNNFGIMKNNLKFALLPTREFNVNFIRSEKFSKVHYAFYLNAFFDLGFVDNFFPQQELNNELENTLLMGYGLGLDFVTYYDLVFRFEYSFNRMNEHGFFLHFIAPI